MGGPRPFSRKHTISGMQGESLALNLELPARKLDERPPENLTSDDEIRLTDSILPRMVERLGPEVGCSLMNLYRRLPGEE